jgi:hypothetical protein
MLERNRSAPDCAVIPVLFYPDVPEAVAWLTSVLPFTERLRNSEDRRQLVHGNGAIEVNTGRIHLCVPHIEVDMVRGEVQARGDST